MARFAYRADLEQFAHALEEAKWLSDREGRVIQETDLDHDQPEHTADALSYGIAYYCFRGPVSLRSVSTRGRHRPYTVGLLHMDV